MAAEALAEAQVRVVMLRAEDADSVAAVRRAAERPVAADSPVEPVDAGAAELARFRV